MSNCNKCVWFRSDELLKVGTIKPEGKEYCGFHMLFFNSFDYCNDFKEEYFEAKENSISSKEYDMNLDLSIEKIDET